MSEEDNKIDHAHVFFWILIIGIIVWAAAGANVNSKMPLSAPPGYEYVSPEELRGE